MKRLVLLSTIVFTLGLSGLRADEGVKVSPIDHAATLKECGGCHIAFPPQMLPSRSWTKMMGDLANHFGENATLDQAVQDDIATYLAAHAADAPATKGGARFTKGTRRRHRSASDHRNTVLEAGARRNRGESL